MKEDWKCYECGKLMSQADKENYVSNVDYCCSGYDCGCQGMATEPPGCMDCEKLYLMLETLKHVSLSYRKKPYDPYF